MYSLNVISVRCFNYPAIVSQNKYFRLVAFTVTYYENTPRSFFSTIADILLPVEMNFYTCASERQFKFVTYLTGKFTLRNLLIR